MEADLVDPPVEAVAMKDLRKRWLLIAASVVLVIAVVLGVVLGLVLPDGSGSDEPPTAIIWSGVG